MEQPVPRHRRWVDRSLNGLRAYVWNRRALGAILVASPAILASAGSLAVGMAIDDKLSALGRQRDAISQEIGRLDLFTKEFESKELLRASFLVTLTNAGAADPFKYALDKLYRLNAAGSLRRIAASIDPSSWKNRIADYDILVASDYNDIGAVQKLTDVENGLVHDALRRITDQQASLNRLSDRIDRLESRKTTAQSVLNGLMYVLTVLVFFMKTAT